MKEKLAIRELEGDLGSSSKTQYPQDPSKGMQEEVDSGRGERGMQIL